MNEEKEGEPKEQTIIEGPRAVTGRLREFAMRWFPHKPGNMVLKDHRLIPWEDFEADLQAETGSTWEVDYP